MAIKKVHQGDMWLQPKFKVPHSDLLFFTGQGLDTHMALQVPAVQAGPSHLCPQLLMVVCPHGALILIKQQKWLI